MIVNGKALLDKAPIKDMFTSKMKSFGVSYGLSEAGYDIRIKQDVFFNADPNNYPQEIVRLDGVESLGRFTLASSIEKFQMPDDLIGIIHDKSTWARQGLTVQNTVAECGWEGYLTLELVYHGQGELHIPAGAGIAQVLFHQVVEPVSYSGKYQGQGNEPVSAIMEN